MADSGVLDRLRFCAYPIRGLQEEHIDDGAISLGHAKGSPSAERLIAMTKLISVDKLTIRVIAMGVHQALAKLYEMRKSLKDR